jgi:UDP-glucose 4-epimerase
MRANGRIVRDYVPVSYVVKIIQIAAERSWPAGCFQAFNIGSGRGISNGEIAAMTQRILKGHGRKLKIDVRNPIASGEAYTAVLKVTDTERVFGLERPTEHEVTKAVEEAVDYWLSHDSQSAPPLQASETK